jgi:hypothetical protein
LCIRSCSGVVAPSGRGQNMLSSQPAIQVQEQLRSGCIVGCARPSIGHPEFALATCTGETFFDFSSGVGSRESVLPLPLLFTGSVTGSFPHAKWRRKNSKSDVCASVIRTGDFLAT